MREIKFRAWAYIPCHTLITIPGVGSNWQGNYEICEVLTIHMKTHKVRVRYSTDEGIGVTDLPINDKCVLMQYTGLKDKNGKESYEHDIVKAYVHNGLYQDEWIAEIVFEKGRFGIRYGDLYKEFYPLSAFYKATKIKYVPNIGEVVVESEPMFEIIGNRWENPELLGGD